MSCDYGVWYSDTPPTKEEAAKIYVALCEQWPFLQGENHGVRAFYNELTGRWPELDTVPEEKIDDKDYCPWSCAISHSGMAVVTPCVWSMAGKVGSSIEELARKYKLVFFDPQSERVVLPEHLKGVRAQRGTGSGERSADRRGRICQPPPPPRMI
jgi:hypothetical protein